MPRVWLYQEVDYFHGDVLRTEMHLEEVPNSKPVEINASLFRQILAANKKYDKFQGILDKFYVEAVRHPASVRRVR